MNLRTFQHPYTCVHTPQVQREREEKAEEEKTILMKTGIFYTKKKF